MALTGTEYLVSAYGDYNAGVFCDVSGGYLVIQGEYSATATIADLSDLSDFCTYSTPGGGAYFRWGGIYSVGSKCFMEFNTYSWGSWNGGGGWGYLDVPLGTWTTKEGNLFGSNRFWRPYVGAGNWLVSKDKKYQISTDTISAYPHSHGNVGRHGTSLYSWSGTTMYLLDPSTSSESSIASMPYTAPGGRHATNIGSVMWWQHSANTLVGFDVVAGSALVVVLSPAGANAPSSLTAGADGYLYGILAAYAVDDKMFICDPATGKWANDTLPPGVAQTGGGSSRLNLVRYGSKLYTASSVPLTW